VAHFTGDVRAMTRLSVLADRIIRCQAQRALDLDPLQADKVLKRSVQKAKLLVDALSQKPWSTDSKVRWSFIKTSYRDFFTMNAQLATIDKASLAKLAQQAEGLAAVTDMLADSLAQDMGAMAQTLTVTARLQRLSQQLAAYHLMARAGVNTPQQALKIERGRASFVQLHTRLRHSELGTDAIARHHGLLQQQWLMMNQALTAGDQHTQATEHVLATSDQILHSLTALFAAYEDLLETVY
jgi:hypothetical protein